ncbi:MAG: T9SS type A sorting domain-containing protein [Calditrichaeota bacterium]|nr:T9SS type A sorting domain-containing protein [Calditrichota bacterium]
MIQYIKSNYVLLFAVLFFLNLYGQIPNAGFEDWIDGNPVGWLTNNAPPTVVPITQSATSHSGNSAARGEVVSISSFVLAPSMTSIDPQNSNIGFPVSQRYAQISGWYQFSGTGNSVLLINVFMSYISATDTTGVGAGAFISGTNTGSYTQFSAPISYVPGSEIPNVAWITVQISDTVTGLPAIGNFFLIDDLSLEGIVGVEDPAQNPVSGDYQLHQNYPNPFNPSTTISFNLPGVSEVAIVIFNQLGEEVDRIQVGRLGAGNHSVEWNAENYPSGIYYYQLQTKNQKMIRKMILLR